jgi:hypothetical protein
MKETDYHLFRNAIFEVKRIIGVPCEICGLTSEEL